MGAAPPLNRMHQLPTRGDCNVAKLTSLRLAGWKSIRDMDLEFRALNLLIGANGAGKSNLVSFFKLMNEMMGSRFQVQVGETGAESLLHYGPKRTPAIEADFRFSTEEGKNSYSMRLVPVAGNTLMFAEEKLEFLRDGAVQPFSRILGGGHREYAEPVNRHG